MAFSGLLRILLLFILVVNVQVFTLSDLLMPKRCPKSQEKCEFKERDICKKDKNCPGNMKCCVFGCGKKCVDLKEDICSLPKDIGPCLALFPRWWYDKKNDTCYDFDYGGCQGNNNNFQSKDLCLSVCSKKHICSLPQVVGPCLALLPRWWYNMETQACSKFMYGGCQGNNNNFRSESACKAFCSEK
ncbi:eppin-like isoform X1 [Phyllostomus hastatus]|uniref:eppin-like isoform X1 n=1 Tax=Phyllostomus hastatus TaxID=9423 RepID=UPI001E684B2A|nr:eppin-like isoform X1 [Phyllostomus hastatus]